MKFKELFQGTKKRYKKGQINKYVMHASLIFQKFEQRFMRWISKIMLQIKRDFKIKLDFLLRAPRVIDNRKVFPNLEGDDPEKVSGEEQSDLMVTWEEAFPFVFTIEIFKAEERFSALK